MSYYVHEIPGRLRIKIPELKRDHHAALNLKHLLIRLSGVESVSVNTVTGSVVLQFDPRVVASQAILTLLMREGYIDLGRAISNEQYVESAVSKVSRTASKALLGLALDRAFQGTPFALLTALI